MRFTGIAGKVWLSIGIFAIGFLISIGFGQFQGFSTERRLRKTAAALFPLAQRTQEAAESFNRMVRSFNDAVMTEDESALDRAVQEADQTTKSLRSSATLAGVDPERQKTVSGLANSLQTVATQGRATYGGMLRAKGNLTPELQQSTRMLAEQIDSTKKGLQLLADQASKDLQSELQLLERESIWHRNLSLNLLAATLLITGFFANRTIQHSVVGPVARVIRGVEIAAGEAALASDQVAKSGGQVAGSANDQAVYLKETSASLTHFATMTRNNAELATKADRVMGDVRHEVEAATVTMQNLTVAIRDISTASHQVAGILKTIEELAFHTNILALNAAVEAARAGEAGAGFSVVADEVRSLAHRSADAAQNIAVLIEGTLAKVDGGSAMASASSKAFAAISAAIVGGSNIVADIARANEEQRRGVDQISSAVSKMDQVTQTNAALAQETAAAAATMSEQIVSTRNYIDELAELIGITSL